MWWHIIKQRLQRCVFLYDRMRDLFTQAGIVWISWHLFSRQSFNAPPRSKMKLWKSATFAFMLCGAALSILLVKNIGRTRPRTKQHTSSSSSRQPSSSDSASGYLPPLSPTESPVVPPQMGGLHRRARSADGMNSLLSECKINCYWHSSLSGLIGRGLQGGQREHLVPDSVVYRGDFNVIQEPAVN